MKPDDPDFEFTDEQLQAVLQRVGKEARQAAFAAGRSVMVIRDSNLVEMFPDGTERIVGQIPSGATGDRIE